MLSSRAKIHRNAARLPHLHLHHRSAGAALSLVVNSRAGYATNEAQAGSESIKHLIKGPVTPLTIFATSPPPAPHPSTYLVPASAADGAALDFRLSFALTKVQQIKEEHFKEEMGVFKILYERPFLREYQNVMLEKQQQRKNERLAARKAEKEKKRQGLLPKDRKKTLFELEQERQRKVYLQTLRYPFQLPEIGVKGEELKRYFNFIGTHSEKDIYDRLYPEFFGDTREIVEGLVPHKHHPYVWQTFFDPENPNEYPNQAETEGDVWESLNKTDEEQISDIIDEMEGEQEREARFANWEKDPARFKGKWTPRSWPKEDLELSHIKHRARNLRYLRDQLKKHGLLTEEEESTSREVLLKLEGSGSEETQPITDDASDDEALDSKLSDDETLFLLFDDDAEDQKPTPVATTTTTTTTAATATAAGGPAKAARPAHMLSDENDITALLNAVLPQEPAAQPAEAVEPQLEASATAGTTAAATAADVATDSAEWRAKVAKFQAEMKKRSRDGATEEDLQEELTNFLSDESTVPDDDETDWDTKLEDIPGLDGSSAGFHTSDGKSLSHAEGMEQAREREARLHRLQEHVKVPFDDSQKKQVFANEPVPGEPAIEFIHSYSMALTPPPTHQIALDPDVMMGSLSRRDFLQRKVVMKVHVPSLSLPPIVQQRLVSLVGTRYDAGSGWLKLVGDKHPNRHLNHKYLKLLMRELISESFLVDPRYSPLSDLNIEDPSSLRRNYSLPSQLQSILDGKAGQQGWEYKMFTFAGRYPAPEEVAEQTARLRQRLASALSS